jgi:2'-5' RNA ligase
MDDEVRLYVLAEFDSRTEERLSNYRDLMIGAGYVGTQTVGITNHITLGSFDLSETRALSSRVGREKGSAIPVRFAATGTFGDRVLFIRPEEDAALSKLHARFDDGGNWVPHCTMYLSEEGGVAPAMAYLDSIFVPFEGLITRISLHEFFPDKLVEAVDLRAD